MLDLIFKPMVVNTRDEEKAAFSRRLNNACDAFPNCPKDPPKNHGRVSWLARQFNPPLSAQAVQKWFDGVSIPDQTNIARLAGILKADTSWLLAGPGDDFVPQISPDERLRNVIRAWPEMGDDMRKAFEHLSGLSLPLPDKKN
jgi:hypothetical protein